MEFSLRVTSRIVSTSMVDNRNLADELNKKGDVELINEKGK